MKKWVGAGFILALLGTVYFFPTEMFKVAHDVWFRVYGFKRYTINEMEVLTNSHGDSDECVLLIHGIGDQPTAWTKTLINSKDMFGDAIVYAPDIHSYTSSVLNQPEKLQTRSIAKKLSEDILPLCRSWNVLGNSWGGAIALALPQNQIQKIILISSAGLKFNLNDLQNDYRFMTKENAYDFMKKSRIHPPKFPLFVMDGIVKRFQKLDIVRIMEAQKGLLTLEDDSVAVKRQDVLLIWGAKDGVFPREHFLTFQKMFPEWKFQLLENCSHKSQQECFEDIRKLTKSFLARDDKFLSKN